MESDRRLKHERRQNRRLFNFHRLNGRRRRLRRDGDVIATDQTDFYRADLLFVVICVLIFSAADAHNTLLLLDAGASELNPLMDYLIQWDKDIFVYAKLAITGVGLIALVGCEYSTLWRHYRASYFLYLILAIYLILILYQSSLMPEGLPGLVLR